MNDLELYRTMFLIRAFEERALAEFSTGKLVGTTHAYIGQEANAVAILSQILDGDVVWSNHRCHGHFLAYGGDPDPLAAELMGKATGLVGGRGGSQHIHWKNFYSNGIQGGIVPVAAGMAMAAKLDSRPNISIVFIGDGTLGQGVLYETLNMAALWQLPLLVVVENNHYAQTTPIQLGVAGHIADRFAAFGIKHFEVTSSDVRELVPVAGAAIDHVRHGQAPAALVLNTNRFSAHSKGDDTRPKELVEQLRQQFDPIRIQVGRLDDDHRKNVEDAVRQQIDAAFLAANLAPYPTLQEQA